MVSMEASFRLDNLNCNDQLHADKGATDENHFFPSWAAFVGVSKWFLKKISTEWPTSIAFLGIVYASGSVHIFKLHIFN